MRRVPIKMVGFLVKAPRGLADVRLQLMVNEHQSTRYRWSHDAPWRNEHEIICVNLG
jgi:hypothetical protein